MLDSSAVGPGFKLQPRRCRVTVLGKLFTPIVPLFTKQQNCGGSCRPGGKWWRPTARFMTYVTCRLTAKTRDQLRNPTLGNRVWATFFTYTALRSRSLRPCKYQTSIVRMHVPHSAAYLRNLSLFLTQMTRYLLHIGWLWHIFVPYLCQSFFAAIL